jgi:pilus assembly protein Flp/PilA
MRLFALLTRLGKDEDGAALLEYTVLMGLLLVATIATVTLVGGWINGRWIALNAALPGK